MGAGTYLSYLVFGVLYFIPTFVAISKRRKDVIKIFVYNAVFGWSVIGWLIVLLRCFLDDGFL